MNVYGLYLEELENYFVEKGDKKFRARQLFEWLYKKKISSFDEMTNIKHTLVEEIKGDFSLNEIRLKEKCPSTDGTIKFLFELNDGNLIETVLMRHEYGYSICVTSQVGCNMGCTFCASGLLKKQRDLEPHEMVLQIMNVENEIKERISSVVIMGIGEPFDNYDSVMKFIRIINSPYGLEIGARHITVSTSGIIPRIIDFGKEDLQVNLAISLHAATDDVRDLIMPINHKYPIEELIKTLRQYIRDTNRRVTIEYILLNDFNDRVVDANNLVKLLRGLNVYVNLIPYNEVSENGYKRSSNVQSFFDILKKNNINVTKRREQGSDIEAACGQLRAKRTV